MGCISVAYMWVLYDCAHDFVLAALSGGKSRGGAKRVLCSLFGWLLVGEGLGFTRTPWLWKAVIGGNTAVLACRLWSRSSTARSHPGPSDWLPPIQRTRPNQTHTWAGNRSEKVRTGFPFCTMALCQMFYGQLMAQFIWDCASAALKDAHSSLTALVLFQCWVVSLDFGESRHSPPPWNKHRHYPPFSAHCLLCLVCGALNGLFIKMRA